MTDKYEKKGWEQVKKTTHYIEYRRPKKFNIIAFIVLSLLLNVIGMFGYLIYYLTRPAWQTKVVRRR